MWLKISFAGRRHYLAVVGTDGNLYFVAREVAKMLGYRQPYEFARRHHTRNLNSVLPSRYRRYVSNSTVYALTFEDMMAVIEKTSGHHMMPQEEMSQMVELFRDGIVEHKFPELLPFAPKVAHVAMIFKAEGEEEEGTIKFRDWLRAYVEMVKIHLDLETRTVLVAPPSVESRYGEGEEEEQRKTTEDGGYEMVVKAEGIWNLNSDKALEDVFQNLKRKMQEMDSTTKGNDMYELRVKIGRKEMV